MKINVVLPSEEIDLSALLQRLQQAPVMRPFAPTLMEFVTALSHALLNTEGTRDYPALIALGYWFRPAQLKQMQRTFAAQYSEHAVRPRGLVFHITPANVDTIFVYSWLLSCLVGNTNILRLSTTERPLMNWLLNIVSTVLQKPQFAWMTQRVAIVRYGRDDTISGAISAQCAMRVIWGGDATVQHIRSLPLPPRSTELTFADRVSFCLLDAASVLHSTTLPELVRRFLVDMTTFEQMGCSSPRALFWLGDATTISAAHQRFWAAVDALAPAMETPLNEASAGLLRLANAMSYAATHHVEAQPVANLMHMPTRLFVNQWQTTTLQEHEGMGLILEGRIQSLGDLNGLVDNRVQTISAFGFEHADLYDWLMQLPTGAVDRIVNIGSALDFAAIWDGNDLLQQFTQITTIPRAKP